MRAGPTGRKLSIGFLKNINSKFLQIGPAHMHTVLEHTVRVPTDSLSR